MAIAEFGAFFAATLCAMLIVGTQRVHGRLTEDAIAGLPQKVNPIAVPRVGGVAILAGLAAGLGMLGDAAAELQPAIALLVLAGIPALAGGLVEDLTRHLSSGRRLLFTFVSAAIGYFLLDARIASIDVPGADALLALPAASFLFTLFAVGGYSHAMNIVDGLNGVAGAVALITLGAIAYVAATVGDGQVLVASALTMAAVGGFLVWNFPRGRLFAGDGGAYFVGFVIAELAILLVRRNSDVSPWFALLALGYPVWETMFSMYRRRVKRGRSTDTPDALHLHTLIYRRVIRWMPAARQAQHRQLRNSLSSPYLWVLCALCVVPAAALWDRTLALQAATAAFAVVYVWFYRRIVRFRVPRWLILRTDFGLSRVDPKLGLAPRIREAEGLDERKAGRPAGEPEPHSK